MSEEASPGSRRGCLILWCVVGLGLLGLALVLARSSAAQPQSSTGSDFTLSTYDGQAITLSDLRGQVVVINFWSSWCDHCTDEAPALEKAWQLYRNQGVLFIGVDCDDNQAEGRKFVKQYGVSYPNGPDLSDRISDAYFIQGLPETYFIDQRGEIAFIAMGPVSYGELIAEIERLLDR